MFALELHVINNGKTTEKNDERENCVKISKKITFIFLKQKIKTTISNASEENKAYTRSIKNIEQVNRVYLTIEQINLVLTNLIRNNQELVPDRIKNSSILYSAAAL